MTCNRPKRFFADCVILATAEAQDEWRRKNECGRPAVVSVPWTIAGHTVRVSRCQEHSGRDLK